MLCHIFDDFFLVSFTTNKAFSPLKVLFNAKKQWIARVYNNHLCGQARVQSLIKERLMRANEKEEERD